MHCVSCMTGECLRFQGYAFHVISTTSEWLTGICIMVYYLTFVPEFRKLSLEPIVVKRRLEEPATDNIDVNA